MNSWPDALAGVPEESIIGPIFSLIYTNDLSDNLQCNSKLFSDYISFFETMDNINKATNTDLTKIKK